MLSDLFDVYEPENMMAVVVSFVFFVLFFIAQSIDFNNVLKDFEVSNNVLEKGKLIYIYMSGYYIFIIKFFIAFLTLALLVAIISIIIAGFVGVISVSTKRDVNAADVSEVLISIKKGVANTGKFVLSYMSLNHFFLIYLVIIPVFLLMFYLLFVLTLYEPKNIKSSDQDERIMGTQHAFFFYLYISLAVIGMIYIFGLYMKDRRK
jgi:hypothetical protein